MNDSIRSVVSVALEVQAMIKRHTGIKPVLAGGCARDVFYGYVPKDFDLILPENVNYQDISGFFASIGKAPRLISMYNGNSSDRIKTVQKFNYQDIEFDLIVYAVQEDGEMCDYFDFNFNQFELQGHTAIFKGDKSYWNKTEGGVRELISIRGDHSEKREAYIKDKWSRYQLKHLQKSKSLDDTDYEMASFFDGL